MRACLLLLLGVAAAALAAAEDPGRAYRSGDFKFRYPRELVVLQDYVYTEAGAAGPRHVVVLRHQGAETGDLRSVEINMLRTLKRRMTCGDYSVCRVVDGVVIGTNSEDPDFRKAFDAVAASFTAR